MRDKLVFVTTAFFLILFAASSFAQEQFSCMEYDTDRPGSDYRNFDLPEPLPKLCQAECAKDKKCKAYTYVRPGYQGLKSRCWLKSSVPNPISNPCCVSGVKLSQVQPLPDIVISAIEIFPAQPTAGVSFALNVYVGNAGKAVSGKYDIAMYIKDVDRGNTYPIGTFRKEKMFPGENYAVYSSTDRLVNDSGKFKVHVEIKPFLFKDANTQNNVKIKSFTVQ